MGSGTPAESSRKLSPALFPARACGKFKIQASRVLKLEIFQEYQILMGTMSEWPMAAAVTAPVSP
jgi:hypothetical protein